MSEQQQRQEAFRNAGRVGLFYAAAALLPFAVVAYLLARPQRGPLAVSYARPGMHVVAEPSPAPPLRRQPASRHLHGPPPVTRAGRRRRPSHQDEVPSIPSPSADSDQEERRIVASLARAVTAVEQSHSAFNRRREAETRAALQADAAEAERHPAVTDSIPQ